MSRNGQKARPETRVHLRAIERLQYIDRAVQSGTYPNCDALCAAIENGTGLRVTRRTILRDLSALRDRLGAPIDYCPKRRGYFYKKPGFSLPPQTFSEGDFLAFFIAEYALRFVGYEPAATTLRHGLAKLSSLLPDSVSVDLVSLGEGLSFGTHPFAAAEWKTLDALRVAMSDGRTVEFDYFSPHRRSRTHRRVDPLHLHCDNGDWYIISFDHERRDKRDFHAARISNLRVTDSYFEPPPDWDPQKYLSSGFSMTRGGRLTTVGIHFDDYQAQWIRERTVFHPDETREELPDGSLRLSFKIGENGLEAVARFCLTYAGHCRVEKPNKLKILVRKKLQKGLNLHM